MEHKTLSKSVLKSYLPEESQSSYGDIVDIYYRELGEYTDDEFLELNSEEIEDLKNGYSKVFNVSNVTFADIYVLNHLLKYGITNENERKALRYAVENGSLNYVKIYYDKEEKKVHNNPIQLSSIIRSAVINDQFDIVEYLVGLYVARHELNEEKRGSVLRYMLSLPLIAKKTSPEMRQYLKDLYKFYTGRNYVTPDRPNVYRDE